MPLNRRFFFEEIKLRLFDGALRSSQVVSIEAIIDTWETRQERSDDRWLAYMLGTVHHETGRSMRPVRETFASSDEKAIIILNRSWKANRMPSVKSDYWSLDSNGKSWLGRGYVQLTHKTNYERMAAITGVDLVSYPELAMNVDTATKILIDGMVFGIFTGKKLGDYFNPDKDDWVNARRIINGLDKAELVGSYARKYYSAISHIL